MSSHVEVQPQQIVRDGVAPTYNAASEDGNKFANNGKTYLHFKNEAQASRTITVTTTAQVDGFDVADHEITVPAESERLCGPFNTGTFGSVVEMDYDDESDLSFAVLRP